jgi:hypothetical protein
MTTYLKVTVRFLSHTEGGRRHPPSLPGFMPHFVVPPSNEMLGITFIDGPVDILPNDDAMATVRCLYEPMVSYDGLRVGTQFQIVEGPKLIGSGTVLNRH